jgi:hypothetical protein
LNAVRLPKFSAASSTPPSPLRRHLDRLQCRWDHAATSPTTSNAITVTAAGSTSPDRHRRTQEPCRPPDRHRRRVHAARPSPPRKGTASSSRLSPPLGPCRLTSSTCSSSVNPLPLSFPPSVNFVLLCLDVCLYDYA